ncbi:IclR family transcriptional regulator [Kitasatospora viridis]|uniref:IclR family transcriptional regulator n=1 Tax=Kitasatospora viridis TaxID=281105 RepID=A0A561UH84_9ACTN|nr:IclR family transcriptional regulator [Kitasatospora viridis]
MRHTASSIGTRPPGSGPTLIGSVQRALRLLEAVGGFLQGATAKQLARAADLPLGTTYHLLRTLTHEGYLRRADGRFYYGASVAGISRAEDRQRARRRLRAALAELRDELDAAVYFAVYREGEVELVEVAASERRPAVAEWADFRATAHAHAIGKCLLGQLTGEQRRDHLARHRPVELTAATTTEASVLLRRFAAPAPGPVFEHQEYAVGTVCAAVPLACGATVGTIAISLPIEQEGRLARTADTLLTSINGLAGTFGASFTI